MSALVTSVTVKHCCRRASDAAVTLSGRKCLLFIWGIGGGATSEPLLCSSLCSAEQLMGTGTLCSYLPAGIQAGQLCHKPGSETSNAVPAWLPTLVSPKKAFFNSCFQLSNDSDTAARVKRSSSPSEFYGRRPWVSSLKESLLGPAISWIQIFNLTDGMRRSSSAMYLLAQGLCFSNRLVDFCKYLVFRSLGEGRLGGNE